MNIKEINNEHFQKNWACKQTNCSVQRSMQPVRIAQGDYFLRSKHNYRDKEAIGTLPEGKRSLGSNKKGG